MIALLISGQAYAWSIYPPLTIPRKTSHEIFMSDLLLHDRDLQNTIKYRCEHEVTKHTIENDGAKKLAICTIWLHITQAFENGWPRKSDVRHSTDGWVVNGYGFKELARDNTQLMAYRETCLDNVTETQVDALQNYAYLYPNIPRECILYVKARRHNIFGHYLPKEDFGLVARLRMKIVDCVVEGLRLVDENSFYESNVKGLNNAQH